jgi:hypothetical protein
MYVVSAPCQPHVENTSVQFVAVSPKATPFLPPLQCVTLIRILVLRVVSVLTSRVVTKLGQVSVAK